MPRGGGRTELEPDPRSDANAPADASPQAMAAETTPAPAPEHEAASKGPPPRQTYDDFIAPTPENLQARAHALQERYGPHGLSVRIERPFVLVGDEGPEVLARHGERTVRWAVQRLEQDYFDAPPDDIIEVWLFGDDESYRSHARAIFDDEPDTPYGYFTPTHSALIMNIATGGGTLVHELVHPYMASNFNACPSWFNEGLASLYEQCGDRDGHIQGMTNWRLPGLQEFITEGRLRSFTSLLGTAYGDFYEDDPGSNYAQARYLCYWLQEKGDLVGFYRDFRRDAAKDRTGLTTLRAHVGDDLEAFQRKWERWVLTLHYG